MPAASDITAYSFEEGVLQRALGSIRGVRLTTEGGTQAEATTLVSRLNSCRVASRKQATKLFLDSDPRWGKSPYDSLTIRKITNMAKLSNPPIPVWVVEILNREAKEGKVTVEDL